MSDFKRRLAHTHEAVSAYNYNILLKNGTAVIVVKANCNVKKTSKMFAEEFGGIKPVLCLNFDANVMLKIRL